MSEVMIAVLASNPIESPVAERNPHSSSSTLIHFTSSLNNNSLSQLPKQNIHNNMIEENSEEEKREESSHLISITPFCHQVAGSGALIKVEQGKIYKPLINRELEVYESIQCHPTLLPFVPTFYGTTDLDCDYLSSLQWKNISKNKKKEGLSLKSEKEEEKENSLSRETTDRDRKEKNTDSIHPWSKLMHSKQKDFLKSQITSSIIIKSSRRRYLVLQDLTHGFQHPCILDVKMGTRQFGDNPSESKRLSKEAKRIATTSATLGIRLCGMQVYSPNTKQYLYFDKYDGRKYDQQALKQVLTLYFNRGRGSGYKVDLNLAQAFLDKLLVLHSILDPSSPYRFYSSSLLFIYEGDMDTNSNNSSAPFQNAEDVNSESARLNDVHLKMIDFAHTHPLLASNERDDGYVLGLVSLINILQDIVKLGLENIM